MLERLRAFQQRCIEAGALVQEPIEIVRPESQRAPQPEPHDSAQSPGLPLAWKRFKESHSALTPESDEAHEALLAWVLAAVTDELAQDGSLQLQRSGRDLAVVLRPPQDSRETALLVRLTNKTPGTSITGAATRSEPGGWAALVPAQRSRR